MKHVIRWNEKTKDNRENISGNNNEFTWEDVPLLRYKEEGTHFKNISRQVLFEGDPKLPVQWRYFEVAEGGNSTLERHQHLHAVMIIRGKGQALIGNEIHNLSCFDVVQIPSMTWHQFRANAGEAFGFLCLVTTERDRPEMPDALAIEEFRRDPELAEFIRI